MDAKMRQLLQYFSFTALMIGMCLPKETGFESSLAYIAVLALLSATAYMAKSLFVGGNTLQRLCGYLSLLHPVAFVFLLWFEVVPPWHTPEGARAFSFAIITDLICFLIAWVPLSRKTS